MRKSKKNLIISQSENPLNPIPLPINQNLGYYDTFISYINSLNNSKYFIGIMMILLNLGSRYLMMELSEDQEQLFNNVIIRRIVIFTVVFIAVRDIWVSLIITAVFIVFVSNLFNTNSSYCIMGKKKGIFRNITKVDYEKAKSVIKLYDLQSNNKPPNDNKSSNNK
jgi:hypothetical protein